jgi:phosphate transport system substrate-binding protein
MRRLLTLFIMPLALAGSMVASAHAEKIVLEGSTTVLPIAQRGAEEFMKKNPSADISVRGGGSGIGIASLIDGTCDIADSSRSMKDSELDKAVANGKNPKAHVVAMDGIAVLVHPSNPIKGLSKQQVKDIYTGRVSDWAQVGGNPGKIVVISRDTSSGTFEAFGELALGGAKVRPDALMQASSQAVASTVSRTPGGIGYAGLAFLSDAVKAIPVDGVMPSKETVLTKKFPYSRPVFMYTDGAPEGLVKEFLDYIKSAEGQAMVEEEGFVGLK